MSELAIHPESYLRTLGRLRDLIFRERAREDSRSHSEASITGATRRMVLSIVGRWKTGGVPLGDIVIFRFRVDHRVLEMRNLPDAIALDHRE
jgi:hypothetical protein